MIGRLLRKLPDFRGKRRVSKILLGSKILQKTDLTVKGKFGCTYILPNIQETIDFEILINGVYEPETILFINQRIKESGKLLDVGANIGAICAPLGMLRRDIHIVSLEASPWVFEYLRQNVSANQLTNLELINKAISSEKGKIVEFFSPKDKFGKGSLAPIFTSEAEKIETTTIDELAATEGNIIDFIKIDVEGFEASAFRGGSKFLSSPQAPDILFEFVDWAEELAGEKIGSSQGVLMDFGYDLYTFFKGKIAERLSHPLLKGGHLIFATKNKQNICIR